MKRRFGDRSDGHKLRKVDPFFRIIPHLMTERNDAQIFFDERVYLENSQKLIRQLRKEGYKVGFLHIVLATMVRTISQKPRVNRFVRGRKTYARNEITVSLAIKKEMSVEGEETTIKVTFDPTDTIYDVCDKVNEEIAKNKVVEEQNNTDKFVKLFNLLPNFMIRFLLWIIRKMDNMGILPRFIIDLSPFHSSVFVTDLGSIGIRPVYHHLYNIGTTSVFIAFGTRSKEQVVCEENGVYHRKAMDIRLVADERIADGYYFARAIKFAFRLMNNPEPLLTPPDEVFVDNEI